MTLQEIINRDIVGKYCIIRSRDQGVMSGYVEAVEGRNAVVREARQLYSWSSKFVLVELAAYGPRTNTDRYSAPSLQPVLMTETCGILPCADEAAKAIQAIKAQEY